MQALLQPDRDTFGAVARAFLAAGAATREASTVATQTTYLNRPIAAFGHVRLKDLRESHLAGLRDEVAASGAKPFSVNHFVSVCVQVLNWAVRQDMLDPNPFRHVEKLAAFGRERTVTDEEFARLLEWTAKNRRRRLAPKYARTGRDILVILRFTAMRPKELRTLRWEWVHFDKYLIVIPAGRHKTGKRTAQPRVIPVLGEAKAVLEARRRDYPRNALVFESFHVRGGYAASTWHNWFKKLADRAGIGPDANGERLTMYSLRHTRITEVLVDEQWPLVVAMNFAGHTRAATTQRYTHVLADDVLKWARDGAKRKKDGLTG